MAFIMNAKILAPAIAVCLAGGALADFNINLDLSGKPMRDLSKTTSKAVVGYISAMHEYGDDYWFVSNKCETAAVMKKAGCSANDPLEVKLPALEALQGQYSVHMLCEALDVPRGTYYNYILRNKRTHTWYAKRREELRLEIQRIYDDSRQIFGAAKICAIMKESGIRVSREMVSELMRDMGDGIVVTEVSGLHAGANAVSGDFSLIAEGYTVVDGKKGKPVEQVTVAGNFYTLLRNIRAVGCDLLFPGGGIGSPSVDIGSIAFAGK